MLSMRSSEDDMTSGIVYATGLANTVKIRSSAPVHAAHAMAYATAASDHGLPPVATSTRLYMTPPCMPLWLRKWAAQPVITALELWAMLLRARFDTFLRVLTA